MNLNLFFAFAAAFLSAALASAVVLHRQRSVASWCFFVGMTTLALDSALGGMESASSFSSQPGELETMSLLIRSLIPGVWLSFSVVYSRGNYREFLFKWRYFLILAFLLPFCLAAGFPGELLQVVAPDGAGVGATIRFGGAGKALNIFLLSANVVVLMNLEQTFRSAIGTTRWRVKFVILGLAVVFGARVYTLSQAVIFSSPNSAMTAVDAVALFVGCILMVIAYPRSGFSEIDVYPSHALLQSSLTVLLAGGYLFVVGVLAQAVVWLGGSENFELRAFVVLLGAAALAVVLISERFRESVNRFVSVHFRRPNHDFRRVWTQLSRCFSSVTTTSGLTTAAVKLISETFNVLSVTVWFVDEQKQRLVRGASTCQTPLDTGDDSAMSLPPEEFRKYSGPFDLEEVREEWGERLRRMSTTQFVTGGHRICVPLLGGDRLLGVAILADRVNGARYSLEELDLLKCIGDQMAGAFLNLRLTEELMLAKQLEAFQTMSTFFVHDLKNAASTLTLMLQNLPIHFNDPAFREDALRGIAATVTRINELIARLSVLRNKLDLNLASCDLNLMVTEALKCLDGVQYLELGTELQTLPQVMADREKIESVLVNLLLNARDAVGKGGRINVETSQRDGLAILAVSDDGCGMSPTFLNESLFRPFQTTKKKGLGIGMFQSKIIIGAHRGRIQVESQPGRGTTFRVSLPIRSRES